MSSKQFTKFKWTRDLIKKFIALLKEHECLYNNKHKLYHNRHHKDEIYESILREMQKDIPSIQVADIRRKIRVLRTQYAHENRSLALSRVYGRVHEPKLWCYENLSFLEKHTTCVTSLLKKKNAATSDDNTKKFSEDDPFNYEEDNSLLMEFCKEEIPLDNADDDLEYEENSKPPETYDAAKYTTPKTETLAFNDRTQNGKYAWVGELVISQVEKIGLEHRGDFIWDIQCLMRKYLLKSKIGNENGQSTKTNETEPTPTFHKSSNISINVNFL